MIELRHQPDLAVSIMSLKAGEAQAVENVDPVDGFHLAADGYEIRQPDLYFLHSILPSGADPDSPFADKRVRLAVEYAIDRRTQCAGIGMGYYEPLFQLATRKSPWYVPELEPREYDPEKAKELLAEAGYPNGFKTTLVSDVRHRRDALVAIQTYLKEVGIETELDMADIALASAITREGWEGILAPGFPNVNIFSGTIRRWGTADDYIGFYRPLGWQPNLVSIRRRFLSRMKRTLG